MDAIVVMILNVKLKFVELIAHVHQIAQDQHIQRCVNAQRIQNAHQIIVQVKIHVSHSVISSRLMAPIMMDAIVRVLKSV